MCKFPVGCIPERTRVFMVNGIGVILYRKQFRSHGGKAGLRRRGVVAARWPSRVYPVRSAGRADPRAHQAGETRTRARTGNGGVGAVPGEGLRAVLVLRALRRLPLPTRAVHLSTGSQAADPGGGIAPARQDRTAGEDRGDLG